MALGVAIEGELNCPPCQDIPLEEQARALRASLSTTDPRRHLMLGAGAAPHRRRRRSLFAGRHRPIDEPLGALEEIVVGIEGSFEHLAGDVLRKRLWTSPPRC
jgi:hypothetical protein